MRDHILNVPSSSKRTAALGAVSGAVPYFIKEVAPAEPRQSPHIACAICSQDLDITDVISGLAAKCITANVWPNGYVIAVSDQFLINLPTTRRQFVLLFFSYL